MSYRTSLSRLFFLTVIVSAGLALGASPPPPGTPAQPTYTPPPTPAPYVTPSQQGYTTPPATTPNPYGNSGQQGYTPTPNPYGYPRQQGYTPTPSTSPYGNSGQYGYTPTPAPPGNTGQYGYTPPAPTNYGGSGYQGYTPTPAPTPYGGAGQRGHPQASTVSLAGTMIRANGCDVMDVYSGPMQGDAVFLRWMNPTSRTDWLQSEFDRYLDRYHGDLWQAFADLGGGLRQATSGFMVEAHMSHNAMISCDGMEMPVVDVVAVRGAFDLSAHRPLSQSFEPLVASGFDTSDREVAEILDAGRTGSSRDVVIDVSGITDESLGCPPWAMVSGRSVDFNCASRAGFVDLRRNGRAVSARGGSRRVRGHFTGEITLHRGTEAVFLTPVFEVSERLD